MPFLQIIFDIYKSTFLLRMEFYFKVKGTNEEIIMMEFVSEMKADSINTAGFDSCLQRNKGQEVCDLRISELLLLRLVKNLPQWFAMVIIPLFNK